LIDQILMELHNQAAIEGVTVENLVVAIEVEVDADDVQGINVHLDVLIFSSLAYAGASFRIVTESFTLELNHDAIQEVLESLYGEEIVTITVRRVYISYDVELDMVAEELQDLQYDYGIEMETEELQDSQYDYEIEIETEEHQGYRYEIVIQQGERIIVLEIGEATLIFVEYDYGYDYEYVYEYYEEQEVSE